MKQLATLFYLLFFAGLYAQDGKNDSLTAANNLTPQECKTAAALYEAMIKTETYVQLHQLENKVVAMSNIPYPRGFRWDSPAEIEKWLTANIQHTTFPSIKEGVEMLHGCFLLTKKLYDENRPLHAYLRRATLEQLREIRAAEEQAAFEGLYEGRSKQ